MKVYPESKRHSYITLLTPECMAAIYSYLEWRKQHGEKISDESPLIRDKFDIFTGRRNKAKPLMVDTIHKTMSRLLKKAAHRFQSSSTRSYASGIFSIAPL